MLNIIHRLKSLKVLSVTLALVLAVIAAVPERSDASVGQVLLGGLAGAGLVLAWPTITAGVGAICAGVGSVAAGATAAVAAGGAAVGGAVAGAGAVAGGAVTSAFGAIGGAIATVTASPLFVPALIVIAVAVGAFLIYRAVKKSKEQKPVRITDSTIKETPAATPPARVTDPYVTFTQNKSPETATTTTAGTPPCSRDAHELYQAAYRRYITALQTDETGTKPETQQALQDLRAAETAYRQCVGSTGK